MLQKYEGENAMPVYEYYCSSCKWRFEHLQPMSRAGEDSQCPECGTVSRRTLSVFAPVSRGGPAEAGFEGGYCGDPGAGGCCGGGACGF